MDAAKQAQLLKRYAEGVEAVLVAVGGLAEADLDRRPAHHGWSARELIHHLAEMARPSSADWSARQAIHYLADVEFLEAVSLRRMLAENIPVLEQWDEELFARRVHYDRPVALSLAAFQGTAQVNMELLERLSEQEWKREGNNGRLWNLTIEDWLEEKVAHIHTGLMQILNAAGSGVGVAVKQ